MPLQPFPKTASENPNYILTYTGDELTQVDLVVDNEYGDDTVYRKTLVWSGGMLDTVSKWVRL